MSEPRITKEAARDIWQALCQKAVAADQDLYYERVSRFLHSKLEELGEETGQDMSLPLGQFLVSEGEDEGSVEYAVEDSLLDLLASALCESIVESGRRGVKAPKKSDRTQWGL